MGGRIRLSDLREGCRTVAPDPGAARVPVVPPPGIKLPPVREQAVVTGPVTEADVTHGYDW